jgi:nucleotide-binding universal stress UspA family protein
MFRSVLLPLDGSALADRALPFAGHLARAAGGRLIVVRAHLPEDDLELRVENPNSSPVERMQSERGMAEDEFGSACKRLREDGLDVEPHFVEGAAADVIYETARAQRASVIVMSTHGRGGFGRWLYGSVADQVLRRVPVPVLLVPSACNQHWADNNMQRVVVPLDGSAVAADALVPARDLAAALGGGMLLLTVVELTAAYPHHSIALGDERRLVEEERAAQYLCEVAAGLGAPNAPPVTTRIAYGDAAAQICAVAREVGAAAIAMASHGRGVIERVLLGSVTTSTVHKSSVPVLVYRPVEPRKTLLEAAIENLDRRTATSGEGVRGGSSV